MAVATVDQLAAEKQSLLACISHFQHHLTTLQVDAVHLEDVLGFECPQALDRDDCMLNASTDHLIRSTHPQDRSLLVVELHGRRQQRHDLENFSSTTQIVMSGFWNSSHIPTGTEMRPDRRAQLREEQCALAGEDLLARLAGSAWVLGEAPRALTSTHACHEGYRPA